PRPRAGALAPPRRRATRPRDAPAGPRADRRRPRRRRSLRPRRRATEARRGLAFHVKHRSPFAHFEDELVALGRAGLRRGPGRAREPGALSFCSNDYLGLAARPSATGAAGAGGSRLIAGERAEHRAAERAFASWLGTEDALLFTSGY